MDEKQIQENIDRLIEALQNLAPGGPGWWEVLAPIVVFVAAVGAWVVGAKNLKKQQQALDKQQTALDQRSKADDRAEWWKRVQWALDATVSTEWVMREYGLRALAVLARSELAGREEKELFDAVWQEPDTEVDEALLDEIVDAAIAAQDDERELEYRLERYERDAPEDALDDDVDPGDNGDHLGGAR